MNPTSNQILNTIATAPAKAQPSLTELAITELAIVGGGMANVAFE